MCESEGVRREQRGFVFPFLLLAPPSQKKSTAICHASARALRGFISAHTPPKEATLDPMLLTSCVLGAGGGAERRRGGGRGVRAREASAAAVGGGGSSAASVGW